MRFKDRRGFCGWRIFEAELRYDAPGRALGLSIVNHGSEPADAELKANAYRIDGPWQISVPAGGRLKRRIPLRKHHNWYDFTLAAKGFERRFAGRIETGRDDVSDPAV